MGLPNRVFAYFTPNCYALISCRRKVTKLATTKIVIHSSAMSKAAVAMLTRTAAHEGGKAGVRVNAVAPGYVETRLVREWLDLQEDPAAALASVLAEIPLGRIADPREIGNAVVFLLSDQASAITGATLAVDCGTGARFAT